MANMEQLSLLEQARLERPGAADTAHVIHLADRLLRELGAEPPIHLEMVASYQGIAAVTRCPLPNGGCLVTDPDTGKVEIRLRAGDHPSRQRFSGFHEVTHTFMPGYRLKTQWRCDPSERTGRQPDVEVLCDVGASELLLPRRYFAADLAGAGFGMQAVEDLAGVYRASLQATAHRVIDLWPEDALLMVCGVATKPVERDDPDAIPKLRVVYSRPKGAWPFVPRHKSLNPESPASRALAGEIVDEFAGDVGVSARHCPYTDSRGRIHDRVLVLYRRPAPTLS